MYLFTAVSVNESCFFNEQCEDVVSQTECRDGRCICKYEKIPNWKKDGTIECVGECIEYYLIYINSSISLLCSTKASNSDAS